MKYVPFPKLTKKFVEECVRITWSDLAWVASNGWFNTKMLADFADELSESDENLRVDLAIAAMNGETEELKNLIDQQAAKSNVLESAISERWMCVAVAWLYQNRKIYDDPWEAIEELWEAFGHSPVLNGLIRWMPLPSGAKSGEVEMLERWRDLANNIHSQLR